MKIKLLFVVTLCSIITYAQDKVYGKPELLLDKEVKILPVSSYNFDRYENFHSDKEMYKVYKGSIYTDEKHLEGRIFKVTEVYKIPEPVYGKIYYRIKLEDITSKEIVYYEYTESLEEQVKYYFEVVGGLTYPEGFFCTMVIKRESDASRTYTTTKNYVGDFIEKTIDLKTKKEVYTFYISSNEVKTPVKKEGLVLNLENGSKIDLPQHPFSYEGQKYFTAIELTKPQLDLLTKHALTGIEIGGIKLYTYKKEYFYMQELLKCMLTMK
jgi:hypothetical protein